MATGALPLEPRPAREFSHACAWDAPGRRVVRAHCGTIMRRTGHSNTPTCPVCKAVEDRRAAPGEAE